MFTEHDGVYLDDNPYKRPGDRLVGATASPFVVC